MVGVNTSEIKYWLEFILQKDLKKMSLNILENLDKVVGFIGDILFVSVLPVTGNVVADYNVVLKCSKRSSGLRENFPVTAIFLNEIFVYEILLPAFVKFQLEKQVGVVFDSVPKFYGKFVSEDVEVIAMENLNTIGYSLWDKKKPLTRRHVDMVIKEFSKFHAISVALEHQKPQEFEKLRSGFSISVTKFAQAMDAHTLIEQFVDELYALLSEDLDENVLCEWQKLKKHVFYALNNLADNTEGLKVIVHCDNWINNFMFKYELNNQNIPLKVAFLDWQMATYSSPVLDLSYFIISSIAEEDIEDVITILKYYYENFILFTEGLGYSVRDIYSFEQLVTDWKKYSKFGITLGTYMLKICLSKEDSLADVVETVERDGKITNAFMCDVKDKALLKKRMRYLVKYAVENDLID